MLALFAFLDLISASSLVFLFFGLAIKPLIIISAVYLLVKGFMFMNDIASFIDVLTAFVLIMSMSVALPKIILIILAIFLIQKSFLSFFS